MVLPGFILFLKIVQTIQNLFRFRMNFRIFFLFLQKGHQDFDIGCIDLQITLGIMEILTVLGLSVHEHRMSFHLLVLSLISFNNVFRFSVYNSSLPWLFTHKYFILFDAVANAIAFLISFQDYSLFVLLFSSLIHVQLFCYPMNCSPPGFSVHGISQGKLLEWLTISLSRGSSQPRDPELAGGFFTTKTPGNPHCQGT